MDNTQQEPAGDAEMQPDSSLLADWAEYNSLFWRLLIMPMRNYE
jgi:hypothetical protein